MWNTKAIRAVLRFGSRVVLVVAGHLSFLGSRFWPSRRIKSMTAEIVTTNNAVTPANANATSIVAFVTTAPGTALGRSARLYEVPSNHLSKLTPIKKMPTAALANMPHLKNTFSSRRLGDSSLMPRLYRAEPPLAQPPQASPSTFFTFARRFFRRAWRR